MSGFRSRMVEKAAREVLENMPARPPELTERVANPFTPECRDLLAVFDVLLSLPLGPDVDSFKPGLRRILEDHALVCEFDNADGADRRAWARDFLARMAAAVLPSLQPADAKA